MGEATRAEGATLHATCDEALAASPPRGRETVKLTVLQVDSTVLPADIARVRDVLPVGANGDLLVLDTRNARIFRVNVSGRVVQVIGQPGEGPGDLTFSPMTGMGPSRLALAGEVLVAADERSLKAYDRDGKVLWDQRISLSPRAMFDGFHLTAEGGTTVRYGESGKFRVRDTTRAVRTSTQVFTFRIDRRRAEPLFRTSNEFVRFPALEAWPDPQPYQRAFRRTWDGDSNGIAIHSFGSYGVCFFDPTGSLVAAHARAIEPYPIDDAERVREMSDAFGGWTDPDARMPFLRQSPRELFEDRWPDAPPRYTDIVMEDRTALVLRRGSATELWVDVFDRERGYVGTFAPPGEELPRRLRNGTAIVVDRENLVVHRYRWRRP